MTRRRTRALIGCLWFGAAISAAPVFIMVGVEEVGEKEKGISRWKEDRTEGEQGTYNMGESKRGGGQVASMDGELMVLMWDKNETKRWSERRGEFREKEEVNDEKKESSGVESVSGIQAFGDEDKTNVQVERKKQNKIKEDEDRGRKVDIDGHRGAIDTRECRCLDYAATSGLLSAMMILSNLYFLIPFFILGLVYSLIGRTLWLRPQSSRNDQSHRHTVKMLGKKHTKFCIKNTQTLVLAYCTF